MSEKAEPAPGLDHEPIPALCLDCRALAPKTWRLDLDRRGGPEIRLCQTHIRARMVRSVWPRGWAFPDR